MDVSGFQLRPVEPIEDSRSILLVSERVTVENADRVSINIREFALILSINIPDDLYREAREIAEAHQVSLEQVFTSAFFEHVSAWRRLRERAARGDREKFLAVLNRVPDVEPEEFDAL